MTSTLTFARRCSLALAIPLVAHAQKRVITHEDIWTFHRIGAPAISPDGRLAVFSVVEPSYDPARTVSDLWLVPTDGSAPPRRFTNTRGGESGAVFSPDGASIAFTARRDGDEADQVYIQPIGGGDARRVTSIETGASSPRFRPDGRAVLFETGFHPRAATLDEQRQLATEQRGRRETSRVYDALPVRIWNVWLEDRQPIIAWQEIDGGSPTIVRVAPLRGSFDATGGEVLNPVWSPDGSTIVFEATANRDRWMSEPVEVSLYAVPARGGSARRITPPGVSYSSATFARDGQALYAVESRAPTARQIYFVDRLARLTGPEWSTIAILTQGWDRSVSSYTVSPDSRQVFVQAEDTGSVRIFRIAATGGKPELVFSPATGAITDLRAAGGTMIGRYSASTDPGQIVRFDAARGGYQALTTFNQAKLAQLQLPQPEHFWFTAKNGKRIHSIIVPPPVVEPGRKYPVVVFPHGGPNIMSADAFSMRWNYHLLTSPGYYLIATNYTGSTGFGEKFADDIERDVLRGPALETLEAIEHAARKYTAMDLTRQCAAGASYGGYMMNWYNGTTRQFRCLVNHAGAVNNESQYGFNDGGFSRELRMGGPIWDTGKTQWNDQSPIRYANLWKTPMLITQGELDYRVPLAESMTTFKLLQRQGIPSRLVVFPDEGHWILKGPNSRKHMEEVMGWLGKYLNGAPR